MTRLLDADDLMEIRSVLERYALACDERAFHELRHCFTEDAVAEYSGRRLEAGVSHIIEYVAPLADYVLSQHVVGTVRAVSHPGGAMVTSYATAHLVRHAENAAHSITHRGLRYDDVFVRTTNGWRIRHRRHNPLWMSTQAVDWPPRGHAPLS